MAFHVALLLLSGFILITPENGSSPVRISVIDETAIRNKDMQTGRIEELPEMEKKEKPEKSGILSRYDNKASSPEKGKKYQASKTVVPREKIAPPAPSMEKSKEDSPAKRSEEPSSKIAALVDPRKRAQDKPALKDVSVFSRNIAPRDNRTDAMRHFEKSENVEKQKRRIASARITDKPVQAPKAPIQPSGLEGAKGSELGKFAMSSTGDVIEMGDEAIVSLNTTSFKYMDYFESVRAAVEDVWAYPEDAIINGLSGRVILRFTLKKTGELENVRLVKSAGHKSLDDEARAAVKLAAPYHPFPQTLDKKRIHVVATFIYQPTFSSIK